MSCLHDLITPLTSEYVMYFSKFSFEGFQIFEVFRVSWNFSSIWRDFKDFIWCFSNINSRFFETSIETRELSVRAGGIINPSIRVIIQYSKRIPLLQNNQVQLWMYNVRHLTSSWTNNSQFTIHDSHKSKAICRHPRSILRVGKRRISH